MMSEHIKVTQDGSVMRVAFDRPEKKNAITAAMYAALADALDAARDDDGVRAVLFEAAGDMFTAGNDIADFMAGDAGLGDPHQTPPVMRFLFGLASAEKTTYRSRAGRRRRCWRHYAVSLRSRLRVRQCDLSYALR